MAKLCAREVPVAAWQYRVTGKIRPLRSDLRPQAQRSGSIIIFRERNLKSGRKVGPSSYHVTKPTFEYQLRETQHTQKRQAKSQRASDNPVFGSRLVLIGLTIEPPGS